MLPILNAVSGSDDCSCQGRCSSEASRGKEELDNNSKLRMGFPG